MTAYIREESRKIQIGLIVGLVFVVIVLSVVLLKVLARMEAMDPSQVTADLSSQQQTGRQPDSTPFDINDDWFSRPFDPDKWDPFAEMQRMQQQMDRMFDDAFGHFGHSPKYRDLARDPAFSPKIDVHEEADRFVIRVDVPGVDQGSIDVKVDGQRVTISGNRESVVADTDKSGRMMRSERRHGKFARTIELSEPVDATKMEGKNEQGVFTIILPKDHKKDNAL